MGKSPDRNPAASETAHKIGALEIHQDLSFEKRNWRVQRLGWAAMALFVLAGAAGAFGRGPISSAWVASSGQALRVDYERFARHGAPTEFRVTVAAAAVEGENLRLNLSRQFLHRQHVEEVQPPPDSTLVSADTITYVFRARPGHQVRILFRITPDDYALQQAELSLAAGTDRVRFGLFVFP